MSLCLSAHKHRKKEILATVWNTPGWPPRRSSAYTWGQSYRARSLLVVTILTAAVLVGCSDSVPLASPDANGDAGDGRVVAHALGDTEVLGYPKRVVALEYSFVQALDALGVPPVGIADDDEPERVAQLRGESIEYTSVGTRLEPNLELVDSLQPDLIVADEVRHPAIYNQLSQIAPTIVLNSWEGSYQDIKDAVVVIADALGDRAAGEEIVSMHEATMADYAAEIPAGEDRTFLLAVATPDAMTLHTSSAFNGSVFDALSLTPAVESTEALESDVSIERLVAVDPDVLFVATDGPGTVFEQWQDNRVWSAISAVSGDMVFEVDRNQYSRFRGLHTAEVLAEDIVQMITDAT